MGGGATAICVYSVQNWQWSWLGNGKHIIRTVG